MLTRTRKDCTDTNSALSCSTAKVDGTQNATSIVRSHFTAATVYTKTPNDSGVTGLLGTVCLATGRIMPVAIGQRGGLSCWSLAHGSVWLRPAERRRRPCPRIRYECGNGTGLLLFESSGAASGAHTQLAFDVPNVDEEIGRLRENGVTFEDYDFPGLKTQDGIAEIDGGRGGWFKDPEGNLIAVFQLASVPATPG